MNKKKLIINHTNIYLIKYFYFKAKTLNARTVCGMLPL